MLTSSTGTKNGSEWSWAEKHWRLKNWKDSRECPVLPYVFVFSNSWKQGIRLDRLLFSISTYAFSFQIFRGEILKICYYYTTFTPKLSKKVKRQFTLGCQTRFWSLHSWRHSKAIWTSSGALVGPACARGLQDLQRSLHTSTIVWILTWRYSLKQRTQTLNIINWSTKFSS